MCKPEKHQDSLRKGLEIVVAVDLGSIHHCNFSKHLKAESAKVSFKTTGTEMKLKIGCMKQGPVVLQNIYLHVR